MRTPAEQTEMDNAPIVGRVSKGTLHERWDFALVPALKLGGQAIRWGWPQPPYFPPSARRCINARASLYP